MTLYTTPQFTVDSFGAYLTKLTDKAGQPVLFERREIDGKRRGGAHVCLPYFGAVAAGALPQHGFGRDVEWSVRVLGDTAVECSYTHEVADMFQGLAAKLRYELDGVGDSLVTTLAVENQGSKSFTLTPGFHPYFAVDPSDVRLNGEPVDLADFEPFKEFPSISEMTIESAGRAVAVSSSDMQHMVVWTNLQGSYLCVEPTHSGHSFDSTKLSGTVLQSGDKISYSYTIEWS